MHDVSILGIGRRIGTEEALRFRVRFDERDVFGAASREAEILERAIVDREDRTRRSELRRHIADRRAIRNRQRRKSLAEKLDELADDALAAQHLGDLEHEIGRGYAFAQLAFETKTNDLGNQHGHGLPEHRGLRFDTADTPREHANAVDHRRVRIRADRGIGKRDIILWVVSDTGTAAPEDDAREILDVDLVHDARVRWDCAEPIERRLAPLQERVTFAIAFEFEIGIFLQRVVRSEVIDLHRMVDDEFDRLQRIDRFWIAAHRRHRIAHRREIDDARHAGEILQQYAGRTKRDLFLRRCARIPSRKRLDICARYRSPIFESQQIFEQNLQTDTADARAW